MDAGNEVWKMLLTLSLSLLMFGVSTLTIYETAMVFARSWGSEQIVTLMVYADLVLMSDKGLW